VAGHKAPENLQQEKGKATVCFFFFIRDVDASRTEESREVAKITGLTNNCVRHLFSFPFFGLTNNCVISFRRVGVKDLLFHGCMHFLEHA
jgi:hypothetical protein